MTTKELQTLVEQKREVVSDAVQKALGQGRPFADHWHYYTNAEMRGLFANRSEFICECEEEYKLTA